LNVDIFKYSLRQFTETPLRFTHLLIYARRPVIIHSALKIYNQRWW